MQQRSARRAVSRLVRAGRKAQPRAESLESRYLLSLYLVSSYADSGPGTLRDAISNSTADIIEITGSGSIVVNSQLEVTRSFSIFGPGASALTISGHNATRIFQIDSGVTVQLESLTIANGHSSAHGGAIFNFGTLVMGYDAVSGNSASLTGGGIANAGTLTITNSVISGNSAGTFGGGIINGGTLNVSNCTISNNSATTGGGVDNAATYSATINSTSISTNGVSTGGGGGLANAGTLFLADSTIANNTALGSAGGHGAGISNSAGALLVTNCTISGNSGAVVGGGLHISSGDVTLYNTIVAANLNSDNASDDVAGTLDSQLPTGRQPSSYNLIGTGGAGGLTNGINGNLTGISDPKLTPLGNYGGPLQTVGILPGSPAVDSGSNALAQDYSASPPTPLFYDDRAMPRIANGTVDIGADELQSEITVNTTSGQTTSTDGTVSLPQAVSIANTELLPTDVRIRFDPIVFPPGANHGISLDRNAGQLELRRTVGTVAIQGDGAGAITVVGGDLVRIFQVDTGVRAEIDGITIAGGQAPARPPLQTVASGGGGVLNLGTLALLSDVITGNGAGTQADGGGVFNAGVLTLGNDQFTENVAGAGPFTGGDGGDGGAIYNTGAMTISDTTFTLNRAGGGGNDAGNGGNGGAICNFGSVVISSSTFSQNTAGGGGGNNTGGNGGAGGAIYSAGTLSITGTLISNNAAGGGQYAPAAGGMGGNGGGIYTNNTFSCQGSAIVNNSAGAGGKAIGGFQAVGGSGGGIYASGRTTLTNVSIAGNHGGSGGHGGGIYNNGATLTLTNVTLNGNVAAAGGGIDNFTALVVGNTIIAGNSSSAAGPDLISVSVTSLGHNLIGVRDGSSGWTSSDLTGTAGSPLDAQVGPVGYYGSPLPVVPLGPNSPAVGAGDPSLIANPPFSGPPFTDEIGLPRIRQSAQGTAVVDIGAVSYRIIPLVVTATSDQDPGLGNVTLDAAVNLAKLSPGNQTVTFQIPSTDPGYDTTTHGFAITTDSSLDLSSPHGMITIRGLGAGVIEVSPPGQQAFIVDPGARAEIDLITINRGGTVNSGGGILNNGSLTLTGVALTNCGAGSSGGAIANNGALTMVDCSVSHSQATSGGGIYNNGALTLDDCTISSNSASNNGGGLLNLGRLTISHTTFANNVAATHGGGLDNPSDGTANIASTTFSGNTANGGGIANEGTLTLLNSTVAGNTSSAAGGGVDDGLGTLTITNCTIAGNTTHATGGGLSIDGGPFGADTTIYNTLIAANHNGSGSADDIAGTFDLVLAPNQQPSSNNLIGTGGSGGLTNGTNGNMVGVTDPKLGPLAINGGPTQTMALLAGSPAIDHGSNALATAAALTTDQRGFGRIYNRVVDIGAFEFGSALPGDLNHDGAVNFADLLALAQNYGASNATWEQGDLNGDGSVGFDDLLILAQNYGRGTNGNPAAAASAVDSDSGIKRRFAFVTPARHTWGLIV